MTMKMKVLAFFSWGSFVASFFLPAVRINIDSFLGWRINVHDIELGWHVAWLCLANIRAVATDPEAWLGVMYGATNILVVVSPFSLLTARGARWRWLAHAMLVATIFNASVAIWLEGAQAVGYYLWLGSFVGLTICLYARTDKRQGAHPMESANNRLQVTAGGVGVDSRRVGLSPAATEPGIMMGIGRDGQ